MKELLKRVIQSKPFITGAIVAALFVASLVASQSQPDGQFSGAENFGGSTPDAQWLIIDRFSGYETKADPSKISLGSNPVGQNTVINDGDRVSIRDFGSTVLGTASTTAEGIRSMHTFRKRSGENILLANSGQMLLYYEEGNDSFEVLKGGYTRDQKFGFADFNVNADLQSYVYFGNATEAFARWTGNHTLTNGAVSGGAGSVTVDSTEGFPDSGTIIYCGTEIAYSAKNSTSFTVASAHACADNRGVAQAVQTYPTNPRGNIYLTANNRLFISGVASSTQAVFFSAYTDATTFSSSAIVTDGTDTSSGIFNLGEGGGGVTGMVLDEGSIYIFKKSIIYKATLNDTLYTLVPLKSFDGKSQTTGALTSGNVFTGKNGVYFVTPDRQIMALSRIEEVDYPQITPISEIIKPSIESSNFATSTGVFWQNNAYISAISEGSTKPDVVFSYNTKVGAWESPIIGWSVGAWTIYDDGTGEALYFGDYNTANVFKVTEGAIDNELGVTANWRTKRLDFGAPHLLKEIENVYVEGYVLDSTTDLTFSLLLDEDGYTQTFTTTFDGTETTYLYGSNDFNLFGFHPFGYKQIGSSEQSGKKKFRVYLNKALTRTPFYSAQFEAAIDGVNQYFEITEIGFRYRLHSQPEKPSLYRNFN